MTMVRVGIWRRADRQRGQSGAAADTETARVNARATTSGRIVSGKIRT
jgi:hypothetical protein